MKRRKLLKLLTAILVISFFTIGVVSFAMAASKKPIKIGLMYGVTGFAAVYNKPAIHGHELAQAEINAAGGLLGRPIRYIIKDTRTKPDVGARMARELILKEKVDFLMGTLSSGVSLAVTQVAKEHKMLYLATIPKTDRLTEDYGHRYVFRISATTTIEGRSMALLEKDTPSLKYYTIAPDYEYGRMVTNAFVDHLKVVKPQAKIIGQEWPKLGTMEYTRFITKILSKNPDVVVNYFYGSQAIALIKQAKPYGFFEKFRFISGAEIVSTEMAEPLGKDMPDGIWGNAYDLFYWPDTPEHKRWIKAYMDKTGQSYVPGWAIQGYLGTNFLAAAIRKAGTIETEAVIDALEGMTIQSPVGPITIRAFDHQANRGQVYGRTKYDPKRGYAILEDIQFIGSEGLLHTVEEVKAARAAAKKK